ncbi:hypothetical protein [Deinococcus aerophilus]|uniref:Lipoprotein n=1 Tax=Deinococcus aerophilus TaxID=522488 RepID=A0ABQ2GIP8_9DEIO|nr:hypothetical protein [Deinococcus aerophilus]GGL96562.1 hypothetical protein GCM10010841_01200 [Deinococcus aerophilus]
MKLAVVLGSALLLCGCQPALSGRPLAVAHPEARPLTTASPNHGGVSAARAYLADLRASLLIAHLKDRETTTDADCDSPRFENHAPPEQPRVEACRLSIQSSSEYRIEARFSGGLTLIADPDGIRPADAEPLQLLN